MPRLPKPRLRSLRSCCARSPSSRRPAREHARAIRISGRTEADKRVTLRHPCHGRHREPAGEAGRARQSRRLWCMRLGRRRTRRRRSAWPKAWSVRPGRGRRRREAGEGRKRARSCRRTRRAPHLPRPSRNCEGAKAELAQYEIYAPFNGLIDRVPVQRGSTILAGAEVATLINLDPLLAIGEVSERDLQYLKLGDEADIQLGRRRKASRARCAISAVTLRPRRAPSVSRWRSPTRTRQLPAGMTAEITLARTADGRGPAAALGGDAERRRRHRHPRGRQGRQGRVLPDRHRRRHPDGPGAWRHPRRCARHRRRAGSRRRRRSREGRAGRRGNAQEAGRAKPPASN